MHIAISLPRQYQVLLMYEGRMKWLRLWHGTSVTALCWSSVVCWYTLTQSLYTLAASSLLDDLFRYICTEKISRGSCMQAVICFVSCYFSTGAHVGYHSTQLISTNRNTRNQGAAGLPGTLDKYEDKSYLWQLHHWEISIDTYPKCAYDTFLLLLVMSRLGQLCSGCVLPWVYLCSSWTLLLYTYNGLGCTAEQAVKCRVANVPPPPPWRQKDFPLR